MKALSLWQPWASLIISGRKRIETRSWPASYSIRGQRIAIAATGRVIRQQREAYEDPVFQLHYADTGLPPLADLPMGCILGTVVVEGSRLMDEDVMGHLGEQELAFGIYGPGRHAWFLRDPQPLDKRVPARGGQGLWNWGPT